MIDHRLAATTLFYCDPVTPLLRAMVRAEGGERAFIKAVQCTYPATATFEEALARAGKTLRNRIIDFQGRHLGPLLEFGVAAPRDPWTGEATPRCLRFTRTFIEFLGAKWAPLGVANDPTNLNANWVPNVIAAYYAPARDEAATA